MNKNIRIATRKSPLALQQAHHIGQMLQRNDQTRSVEYLHIQTSGDLFLDQSLAAVGGKGLFVKEIEEALLQGQADLAVHSLKDVPFELPSGLCLAAFPKREDPRDVLLLNSKWKSLLGNGATDILNQFPKGARIGSTSLRRKAQVLRLRPDLSCEDLRGNIQTRIKKLVDFDAIILAAAGLNRMGITGLLRIDFSFEEMLPAPGQGVLAVEVCEDAKPIRQMVQSLSDPESEAVVQCERAFLTALKANCHVPVAGFAQVQGSRVVMKGMVLSPDGKQCLTSEQSAPATQAQTLGQGIAQDLIEQGALAWLK